MKLSVRVVSGIDLTKQKKRRGKKAVPLHCRLSLKGKPSFKTQQEVPPALSETTNGAAPAAPSVEWDETFIINKMTSETLASFPLHCALVSGRKTIVGEALVSLGSFADGKPQDKWFQTTRKGAFTGKVRLIVQVMGGDVAVAHEAAMDQEQVAPNVTLAAAPAAVEEQQPQEEYVEDIEAAASAPQGYGYDGDQGAGAPGRRTNKPSIFTIAAVDVARSRFVRKADSYTRAALKKIDAAIRVPVHDDAEEEEEEEEGATYEDYTKEATEYAQEAYGEAGAYLDGAAAEEYHGEYAAESEAAVAGAEATVAPANINAGLHVDASAPGAHVPIDDAAIAAAVSRIFETSDGTNALGLSPVYVPGVRKWERSFASSAPAVAAAAHNLKYAAATDIGSPAVDGSGRAMPTKRSSLRRTLLLKAQAKDSRKVTPLKVFPGQSDEAMTPEDRADAAEAMRVERLSVALTDDDVLPWKTGGMCGYLKKLSCTKSFHAASASADVSHAQSMSTVLAESADATQAVGSLVAHGKQAAMRKLKISRTRWQKRFFAVRNYYLNYYKSSDTYLKSCGVGSEKANGTGLVLASIDLRAIQEFACDGKVIGLRLPGGREYFLSAATETMAAQWVGVMRGRVLEVVEAADKLSGIIASTPARPSPVAMRSGRSLAFAPSSASTGAPAAAAAPASASASAAHIAQEEWIEAPAAAAEDENGGWLYAWDDCAECGYWHHPETEEIVWVDDHMGTGNVASAEQQQQQQQQHGEKKKEEEEQYYAPEAQQQHAYYVEQQYHEHEHAEGADAYYAAAAEAPQQEHAQPAAQQQEYYATYTAEQHAEFAAYHEPYAAAAAAPATASATAPPATAPATAPTTAPAVDEYAIGEGYSSAAASAPALEQQWEAAKSYAPAAVMRFNSSLQPGQPTAPSTADRKASCFTTVRAGAGGNGRRAPKTRPRPNLHREAPPASPVAYPAYGGGEAYDSDSGTTADSPGPLRDEECWMDMDDTPNSRR